MIEPSKIYLFKTW